ncbi:MAG: hypothetical protein K2N65_03175 [Anaeroplasmataceae bacterium]|nr:hypothetical protein [Anaeroplasmataceae bacterium]
MQYQVDQFKVLVSKTQDLENLIRRYYGLKKFKFRILSRSIDARTKENVFYVYRLWIETEEELKGKNISVYTPKDIEPIYKSWKYLDAPIVVGFGPAGIFASLYLARCGAKPIILERGSKIEERVKDVTEFIQNKTLNPNSNVQFGEGGAGTFSDGKLTTNLKNPYIQFILKEFVKHGASEDILIDSMPHIGTDVLRDVVKNIRIEIEKLGGTFYFNTPFLDAKKKEDKLEVTALNHTFYTRHLLLGIGHSARDTIRHLYTNMHLHMEPKAFSMGVRVEHPSLYIDEAQYGPYAKYLPRAYYKLATRYLDRGVYTFCMCPGGYVIASASEEGTIVTNGMSNHLREGANSNSALLVDVRPRDYGPGVLDGLLYQEKYERLAFTLGKAYQAPANLMKEFLVNDVAESIRSIQPTYPHGIALCDLRQCLPDFVIEGIKKGIQDFDKKMKGFYHPDAVMIGIESRSSSPVRILRDENWQSSNPYIYPMGEGAGYAGGITSASLDGLLTAMKIVGEDNECKN